MAKDPFWKSRTWKFRERSSKKPHQSGESCSISQARGMSLHGFSWISTTTLSSAWSSGWDAWMGRWQKICTRYPSKKYGTPPKCAENISSKSKCSMHGSLCGGTARTKTTWKSTIWESYSIRATSSSTRLGFPFSPSFSHTTLLVILLRTQRTTDISIWDTM